MRPRFGIRYVSIIGVLVVLIGLHYVGVLYPLERLWTSSVSVASGGTSSVTRRLIFWHGLQDKAEQDAKIASLEARLQRNESSLAKLDALERENEALRQAIAWNDAKADSAVIGKIIGKPVNYPGTYSIINRGSVDGVEIGYPVYINEDLLIGRIVETNSDTAVIQLITDNQSQFSVKKSDGEEAIGLVQGRLGLGLELSLVPVTETLELGEILVTSGRDQYIPAGYVIGSIDEIQKDPTEFFQNGTVGLAYDPGELSIVSVLLSR